MKTQSKSQVREEMLGVRLLPAEVTAIRECAAAEERSISSVLRRALRASGYRAGASPMQGGDDG